MTDRGNRLARPASSRLARALACSVITLAGLSHVVPLRAAEPAKSVYVDDLTWTELRDRVAAGTTTVLVPIGGTEQTGPYVALGKHNRRAHVLAGRIALGLGNAVVAPTIAYVPEGSITPPTSHMRFTGTISIPSATFQSLLEATARSFRQHGFREVVFMGDHGGYQKDEEKVAAKLNREWAGQPCKVLALVEYYRVTQTDFVKMLEAKGFSDDVIGTHAGLADTALMLAVDPSMVRERALSAAPRPGPADGVHGDPRRATAELGRLGTDRIVERSVQLIRAATAAPKHP